jgi:hypothetical protein
MLTTPLSFLHRSVVFPLVTYLLGASSVPKTIFQVKHGRQGVKKTKSRFCMS